jgi:ABC-type ATPase involved in cell division
VMATHDLELVRAYPHARVLELDQGRLVYDSATKQEATA